MNFQFDSRAEDALYGKTVWRTRSDANGRFISPATSHWELVITKVLGKTAVTIRGPESKATMADCPADAEFFGIQFELGTFMPNLSTPQLVDTAIHFEETVNGRFWLDGTSWEIPTYDNADTFLVHLIKNEVLLYDPLIKKTLEAQAPAISQRTVQRRFKVATGMTYKTIEQIKRAKYAETLLLNGASILDTVFQAGYADQPHLTRAVSHFLGKTPAQIANGQTVD